MKIKSVEIKNRRSIKRLTIQWKDFLVFLWPNNSGKSNLLSSFLFFFDKIECTESDIYRNAGDAESIELTLTFSFEDDEQEEYQSLISGYQGKSGEIKIKKVYRRNWEVIFQKYKENPDLNSHPYLSPDYENYRDRAVLRELPIASVVEELYPTGAITKEKYKDIIARYIDQNQDILEFQREDAGKKNPLNINVVYIPPLKDVSEEFSKGVVAKLLKESLDNVLNDPTIMWMTNQIREGINSLNAGAENRPTALWEFEQAISRCMEDWGARFRINFDTNIENILKSSYLLIVDDGVESSVSSKWHGFQRNLIFSLLKFRNEHNNNQNNKTILLFEEPELYLHPQAQRRIYQELKTISENCIFVGFTTHSNLFVKLDDYQNICKIKKEWVQTRITQVNEDLFWNNRDRFNLIQYIDPSRSEMFFADKVILVEGISEKVIIPYVAKQLWCYREEISIINCEGKTNIPLYQRLCNCFQIPYVVVYDLDHQLWKDQDAHNQADRDTELIRQGLNNNYWTLISLHNDIEEETWMYEWIDLNTKPPKPSPCNVLQTVNTKFENVHESFKENIRQMYS